MLARITGADKEEIREILRKDAPFHAGEGLYLEYLWQNDDDREEVLFLFRTDDLDHARKLIAKLHSQAIKDDPNARLPQMTFLSD